MTRMVHNPWLFCTDTFGVGEDNTTPFVCCGFILWTPPSASVHATSFHLISFPTGLFRPTLLLWIRLWPSLLSRDSFVSRDSFPTRPVSFTIPIPCLYLQGRPVLLSPDIPTHLSRSSHVSSNPVDSFSGGTSKSKVDLFLFCYHILKSHSPTITFPISFWKVLRIMYT